MRKLKLKICQGHVLVYGRAGNLSLFDTKTLIIWEWFGKTLLPD